MDVRVEFSQNQRNYLEEESSRLVKPFMNLPFAETADGADYAVLGVPYDTSTTGRSGTRKGPDAIRRLKGKIGRPCPGSEAPYEPRGVDLGNIPVMNGYTLESLTLITEAVYHVLDQGAIPLVFGGDHMIAYAELRAYAEKYGPVAMVHFDSHSDTSDYGIEWNHGTPFRRAIENGFLDSAHSVQVGIKSFGETYRNEYGREHGMEIIMAPELHRIGMKECARRIREHVGNAPVFITFDIDFLDPSCAPATGTPVAGGFQTYQATQIILNALPGLDVRGFDIVEVMEDYDPGQITSATAQRIALDFIEVIRRNKNEKKED
jgi:agmatinase